jgi:hypothetical protein
LFRRSLYDRRKYYRSRYFSSCSRMKLYRRCEANVWM